MNLKISRKSFLNVLEVALTNILPNFAPWYISYETLLYPHRLSENLSAAIILSWRAKSSHLTKSTGTCLEIPRRRDDRMIV